MIDIKEEITRLRKGNKKVRLLIREQKRIGREPWDGKTNDYNPVKLFQLEAQKISIKDRMKLLEKLV